MPPRSSPPPSGKPRPRKAPPVLPGSWIWLVLLTLPILAWWLEQEKKDLQRLVAAFLDEVARGHQMQRMEWNEERDRLIPLDP